MRARSPPGPAPRARSGPRPPWIGRRPPYASGLLPHARGNAEDALLEVLLQLRPLRFRAVRHHRNAPFDAQHRGPVAVDLPFRESGVSREFGTAPFAYRTLERLRRLLVVVLVERLQLFAAHLVDLFHG